MPSSERRIRVEPGLYETGDHYYACGTPPGAASAKEKALGRVN